MKTLSTPFSLSLHQTAAVVLAAAVVELFLGSLILSGQGTSERFYYDFVFPFEFQANFLGLIEERMRLIVRENRPLKMLEMMPANAAAMLRHRGQPLAAEALLSIERAVIEMCQIGDLALYVTGNVLSELTIPHFKILEGFPLDLPGKQAIRIVGAAAVEKDTLKAMSKQPPASQRCHWKVARDLKLLEPLAEEGLWQWCPRGEVLRRCLVQLWEEECAKQNFHFISSPAAFIGEADERAVTEAHRALFERCGISKVAEIALVTAATQDMDPRAGFLVPKAHFADRAHIFCPREKLLEECISSLHFIMKIPKILGFEFEIVLSVSSQGSQKARSFAAALLQQALEKIGAAYRVDREDCFGTLASIDIRIADALGRRWTGPFISIPDVAMPTSSVLMCSAFGSLERIVALLLEQKGGILPLRFAPEQVRVLVASSIANAYAASVCHMLNARGIRASLDQSQGALKARLYQAIAEKVPYVLLLGEREEKAQVLTVRAYGENQEQTSSLDEFCMRLKSEMGSGNSELTN